jgi:hypothetical protein
MSERYFHDLTAMEFRAMEALGMTWGEVASVYRAPDWCGAGEGALGGMGCWSLIGRLIRCEADCDNCEIKPRKS